MKKSFLILASLALVFVFAACGGGSTPTSAAEEYCDNIMSGDYEALFEMMEDFDKATDEEKAFWIAMAKEKGEKAASAKGGYDKYEILSEEIKEDEDGKTAVVKAKFTFKDGTTDEQSIKLKLIDGKWMLKK